MPKKNPSIERDAYISEKNHKEFFKTLDNIILSNVNYTHIQKMDKLLSRLYTQKGDYIGNIYTDFYIHTLNMYAKYVRKDKKIVSHDNLHGTYWKFDGTYKKKEFGN